MTEKDKTPVYTCNEYRMEMILLALEKRLARPDLSKAEKQSIKAEINRLKVQMDME